MYGHADGFIVPCFWGGKEKKMDYLLYNEGADDLLIQSKFVSKELLRKGGKMRIYGLITQRTGFTEMIVERIIELK